MFQIGNSISKFFHFLLTDYYLKGNHKNMSNLCIEYLVIQSVNTISLS